MVDRNRRQEDFNTDHEQRLIEIEEARLAVKFGNGSAISRTNTRRFTKNSWTQASTTRGDRSGVCEP